MSDTDSELDWKKCTKCLKWLENDKFYSYKKVCKKCHIQGVMASRKKKKDKYNLYVRNYQKEKMTPEKRLILNQKARERYYKLKNNNTLLIC